MRIYIKESDRDVLRRYVSTHTYEMAEAKAKRLRQRAMQTRQGTRRRGALLAMGRFLLREVNLRRLLDEWADEDGE